MFILQKSLVSRLRDAYTYIFSKPHDITFIYQWIFLFSLIYELLKVHQTRKYNTEAG